MKKITVILALFVVIMLCITNVKKDIIIPDSAIRFRILANSNSVYDQAIKMKVENKMQDELYILLKDINNIDEARKIIKNNLSHLNKVLKSEMQDVNYSYDIKYGYNFFPKKKYKGTLYKSGKYESLLITLGKAKGDNWWCVLFPPFCLIDSKENNNIKDVEYKFYI